MITPRLPPSLTELQRALPYIPVDVDRRSAAFVEHDCANSPPFQHQHSFHIARDIVDQGKAGRLWSTTVVGSLSMSPPSDETNHYSSTSTPSRGRRAPTQLVIVSEQGRHSSESRRIVRAQAARASAAQSRVTRARNREGREVSIRGSPSSPSTSDSPASPSGQKSSDPGWPTSVPTADERQNREINEPPANALGNWLQLTFQSPPRSPQSSSPYANSQAPRSHFAAQVSDGRLQLPSAVPRGFATLQRKMDISDSLIGVLSRASCFDFSSPGVQERLHTLLSDLVVGLSMMENKQMSFPGHPIQSFIRVACTALTIFQSQRMNGVSAYVDPTYQRGLDAAWTEAVNLDAKALTEPKLAEVSLWALIVITVTAGPTMHYFWGLLNSLLDDLSCRDWDGTRNILVDFIYPSSYLDAPCRDFFHRLRGRAVAGMC